MLTTNQQIIPLGSIPHGKSYRFKYTITNNGDTEITVTRLHAGCGACTEASIEVAKLSPHTSTTINAVFTPNSTGIQSKSITVYYTIGKGPEQSLVLKFTAEVW